VALFTVALKLVLTGVTRRLGRETGNAAILALASDHRNDVLSAIGVVIGILMSHAGLPWADPLAGMVVSLLVLATGIDILRDSSANLMDTVPGAALNRQINDLLVAVPGVKQVEEIRAHRFGPYLVVNVVIGVDGGLSVAEGDHIASEAERILCDRVDFLRRVYVHFHPARPGLGA
jgi:cation diffusion facilitator family transporter